LTKPTTLLNFRHLLEVHKIGAAMFSRVGELRQANGVKLSGDTIVDANIDRGAALDQK